jgi:hypothetical protein
VDCQEQAGRQGEELKQHCCIEKGARRAPFSFAPAVASVGIHGSIGYSAGIMQSNRSHFGSSSTVLSRRSLLLALRLLP